MTTLSACLAKANDLIDKKSFDTMHMDIEKAKRFSRYTSVDPFKAKERNVAKLVIALDALGAIDSKPRVPAALVAPPAASPSAAAAAAGATQDMLAANAGATIAATTAANAGATIAATTSANAGATSAGCCRQAQCHGLRLALGEASLIAGTPVMDLAHLQMAPELV